MPLSSGAAGDPNRPRSEVVPPPPSKWAQETSGVRRFQV